MKKLISEFCVRDRYRSRKLSRDTCLIESQICTGKVTFKVQKSYKRPVNVRPRTPKSRQSENGYLTFKLECSPKQRSQKSGHKETVSGIEINGSDTANADDDSQNVVGVNLHSWVDSELRDIIEHTNDAADVTYPVVYAYDPSWSELNQINACVVLSNALKETTLLDDDLLTINVPLLYWQHYSAFFDGSLTTKYCGYQRGNQRLVGATLDLQDCLMEKSVRLMTTILRIALMQCEDPVQPVLKQCIEQLIVTAKVRVSAAMPILPFLQAVKALMGISLGIMCGVIGRLVNQLTVLSNISFFAKYELWELYITLLRQSKEYDEAQRQCRLLLSMSEIVSGQHSADTYRARRLTARVICDQGDLELAKASFKSILDVSRQHEMQFVDSGCPREWNTAEDLYRVNVQQGFLDEAAMWLQEALRFSSENYKADSGNVRRVRAEYDSFLQIYANEDTYCVNNWPKPILSLSEAGLARRPLWTPPSVE